MTQTWPLPSGNILPVAKRLTVRTSLAQTHSKEVMWLELKAQAPDPLRRRSLQEQKGQLDVCGSK